MRLMEMAVMNAYKANIATGMRVKGMNGRLKICGNRIRRQLEPRA